MDDKKEENIENFSSFFEENSSIKDNLTDNQIKSSMFGDNEDAQLDINNLSQEQIQEENIDDADLKDAQIEQNDFVQSVENSEINEEKSFEISTTDENIELEAEIKEENFEDYSNNIAENNQAFVEEIFENPEEQELDNGLITVRPVKFKNFSDNIQNRAIKKNLDIMQDINLQISVELGRTKSSIKEVMELEKGSIVELNKIAGEQVEVFVNGKLVAKGEVIVIEDKFGVRVISTNTSSKEE